MQSGDISNRIAPRWLFVFEGVLGSVPPERMAEWKLASRLGRHKRAAACFELEPHVVKVVWDLYWRRDYRFDVVTHLGSAFADHLERRLETDGLPFSNVLAMDVETLVQRLTFMPDVQYVIHGDTEHHLSYGPRGLLVTDPRRLQL